MDRKMGGNVQKESVVLSVLKKGSTIAVTVKGNTIDEHFEFFSPKNKNVSVFATDKTDSLGLNFLEVLDNKNEQTMVFTFRLSSRP